MTLSRSSLCDDAWLLEEVAFSMVGFTRDAQGRAWFGGCLIEQLVASGQVTTPCYLYDLDGIGAEARALLSELGSRDLVAYAVKANSAGSVLRELVRQGVGADVVSGGELLLALEAGVSPDNVVMSGVAKTDLELDLALRSEIRAIQVESVEEMSRVAERARTLGAGTARKAVPVAVRVNPAVTVSTHAHVATGHDKAKFGIPLPSVAEALRLCDQTKELRLVGISTHVGSTQMDTGPYISAARVVCQLARERRALGNPLRYIDFGGGFGIDYGQATPEPPAAFARAAKTLQREMELDDHELVLEPGRCLVGAYGVLVSAVVQTKLTSAGRWLMLDAGMNDLLRPALYQAHHRIEALHTAPSGQPVRVVGPVCESADDFGIHQVSDPEPRFVAIRDAGAYGFTMASQYNGRSLPEEAFLSGGRVVGKSPRLDVRNWVDARLRA
jgi:diaminopimelate decarboxylase